MTQPARFAIVLAAFGCGSVCVSFGCADDFQSPVLPAAKAETPPKGEVTTHTFEQSKIFPGTTREYSIYVPKQYDPAKPACVFVDQDGVQFNAPAVMDKLIDEKAMPVTIGIFITPGRVKAPT